MKNIDYYFAMFLMSLVLLCVIDLTFNYFMGSKLISPYELKNNVLLAFICMGVVKLYNDLKER